MAATVATLTLAGCASGNVHPGPTGATTRLVTAPALTPSSAQPTPTAQPSSVPFLATLGPPCSAAQLEVRVGRGFSNLGNVIVYLIFTDRGTSPCTLRGTPSVQLLDARGRDLTQPVVTDAGFGYVPTFPNDGVGLTPVPREGSPPGQPPEGGVRGQASLPLQYGQQNGCSNSVAAIRIRITGGAFTVPFTIPEAGADGCEITRLLINPFQPAEFAP